MLSGLSKSRQGALHHRQQLQLVYSSRRSEGEKEGVREEFEKCVCVGRGSKGKGSVCKGGGGGARQEAEGDRVRGKKVLLEKRLEREQGGVREEIENGVGRVRANEVSVRRKGKGQIGG